MSTPKKKSVVKKVINKVRSFLDKNLFAPNKKKAAKLLAIKKAEQEIMLQSMAKILRKSFGKTNHRIAHMEGGEKEVYLYDFHSEYQNGISEFEFDGFALGEEDGDQIVTAMPRPLEGRVLTNGGAQIVSAQVNVKGVEPKLKLKPKDVWMELERVPTPISMENLEEKIMVLKMKKEFIRNNHYAKKEVIDMVTRLENRLKYKEFQAFFERFDNTDTDKINALVNKYDLVLRTSDLFIPKFPKEAMVIMKEYKETVKRLCKKSPVFYVIAEKAMFKEEEKRNDPILLVQSPFGIYWQILGAWDKELVLLEEL